MSRSLRRRNQSYEWALGTCHVWFLLRARPLPLRQCLCHSSETGQVCQVLLHPKIGISPAPNSPEYNRQDVGRPSAWDRPVPSWMGHQLFFFFRMLTHSYTPDILPQLLFHYSIILSPLFFIKVSAPIRFELRTHLPVMLLCWIGTKRIKDFHP